MMSTPGVRLEPHFQLEERALINADGHETLVAFAALLADYIRFEETELFETAQRILRAEVLTAIQDPHVQETAPACRPRELSATSSGG
jgi:hypothetical protein